MAENTKIEWCTHSWSPWIGCQKVGPGCDHCYAESLNKRTGGGNWGPGAPRRRTGADYWRKPYRWNTHKPGTVFPSMCDPFDNAVPPEWRRDFGWIIRETPNLTWLLLTKRIGNASEMLRQMFGTAPENVMVGSTFVNQGEVDRDWDELMHVGHRHGVQTFGSFEPMLGPIELPPFGSPYIDWVICGGESGGGARPMHPDWARSLCDQCQAAGVPFFFKQWGEWCPVDAGIVGRSREPQTTDFPLERIGKKRAGRMLDGVTHDGFPAADYARQAEGERLLSSDAAFVKNAKASWQRVIAMHDQPSPDDALAIAAALWATMNADKLIEIAERKASSHAGSAGG